MANNFCFRKHSHPGRLFLASSFFQLKLNWRICPFTWCHMVIEMCDCSLTVSIRLNQDRTVSAELRWAVAYFLSSCVLSRLHHRLTSTGWDSSSSDRFNKKSVTQSHDHLATGLHAVSKQKCKWDLDIQVWTINFWSLHKHANRKQWDTYCKYAVSSS